MRHDRSRWLKEQKVLTLYLGETPYSSHIYLHRARCHEKLGFSDLAASDAYRALLLTDEVLDEEGEYHGQAVEAIGAVRSKKNRSATDGFVGMLSNGSVYSPAKTEEEGSEEEDAESDDECPCNEIAQEHALQSYEILARTLSDCGDLKSAYNFTQRGLMAFPGTAQLQALQVEVLEKYKQTLLHNNCVWDHSDFSPREDLPENGSARREIYPWNDHEPDRFSGKSLSFINTELQESAAKCEVRVTELPVLDKNTSYTKSQSMTIKQLGIFTISHIEPYEPVLLEASVLTSSIRLHDPLCDACSSRLPPFTQEDPLPTCPACEDIFFCSQACFERAQNLYHPAICGVMDYDIVAKDPSPFAATSALYTLLVARTMAMAETQNIHPLDLPQIEYLWGDYSNPNYPAEPTLPFSFSNNIAQPLHLLARLNKDPFAPETVSRYDTWIINTLLAKIRGTANAKMNERTGMPEVAGVHWLWSLANHSCVPNVRWEWEIGGMGFVARGGREVVRWGEDQEVEDGMKRRRGGISKGEEVLNHYCDVELPVKERREWAVGALGGVCVCESRTSPDAAAANKSTGVEPLNTQPTSPQPPKQQPTGDEIPISLTSLPSGFEPVVFPLDLGSRTKSYQTVSSLPSANQFEDLVKAQIRSPGPARAEEVEVESWEERLGAEYADVVDQVRDAVKSRQINVYKVVSGLGKGEYYAVGLDLDGQRILGVRMKGLN